MELRQRVRQAATALRGKSDESQTISFWLSEGLKKRNVRGARTQSLETLLHEWDVDAGVLVDPEVHFLNESTGIVVPRGDEIGKYIGDKDVVRLCSSDELQKLIEKFAMRDPEAAELMGPNKHTSLGAAISKLKRIGQANPTIKMLQKTFDDTHYPQNDEAELLERFPEVDPVFESASVVALSDEDEQAHGHKCDMCDVSWPDDATGQKLYRHVNLGIVTHHGCTQFTADVLAQHPEITTRDALVGSPTSLSQLNRPGTFHVTVHRAADLPGAQLLGTQAPYAKLSLLPWKEPIQTKAAESGGKNPIWKSVHDNTMTFSHMYNSTITPIPLLEVEMWNSNFLADDMIACTLLDMTPLLRYPNIEAKRWFTLSSRAQSLIRDTSSASSSSGALPRVLLSIKFVPLEGKYTTGNEHKFRVHQLKSVGLAIPICSACDRVIVNVLKNIWGYRCETCGIDVHKACIMKAMTKCPCKQPRARSGSDSWSEGQLTPPSSDTEVPSLTRVDVPPVYAKHRGVSFKVLNDDVPHAVGQLFLKFDGLHLCSKQCNPVSKLHAKNIFDGDTYCRLTLDSIVYETSPVLKSADPMYMERICVNVLHRNASLKIEVIDFNSDLCIAELRTSLFQLLQRDADAFVQSHPVMKKARVVLRDFDLTETRPYKKEGEVPLLCGSSKSSRSGDLALPTITNEDRFALTLPADKKAGTGKKKRLGFALVSMDYVESKRELFRVRSDDDGAAAAATALAEKEFSVESLRATIDRLGRTIKLVRWIDTEYGDIISWKNKKKSGVFFVIFVASCLWLNVEHIGAYLLSVVIVYMLYQLHQRLEGRLEKRWVDYEAYDLEQNERLKLYRPIADLLIAVHEASVSEATDRQITASQTLLKDVIVKANYFVKMTYLPNDKKHTYKRGETHFLPSPFSEAIIGWTHPVEKSRHPVWKIAASNSSTSSSSALTSLAPPQQKQRKEFPFRNFNVSWRHNAAVCECERCVAWRASEADDAFTVMQDSCGVDHHAFYFPIPQACRKNFSGRDDLASWKVFPGQLKFDLCLSLTGEARETPDLIVATGVLSLKDFQSATNSSHEVSVPLTSTARLDSSGQQLEGSKHAMDELLVRVELCTHESTSTTAQPNTEKSGRTNSARLRRMASNIVATNKPRIPHVVREYSEAVCESFLEKEKSAVIGQHLFDAFSKVKETIKSLQYDIDMACGTIASIENLFNWTHPWKSALVLAVLVVGMVVLSFVKGRWLVLVFGITEFGAVFLEDSPPSNRVRKILWNLVTSLPTDQDLIELYDGERELFLQGKVAEKLQNVHRRLCLHHQALWAGTVMSKGESDRSYKAWFLAYRPYRFVLWKTQEDADSGSPPYMQLLFERMESIIHSHKLDDKSFIFHVFGTTSTGADEKRSFSFETEEMKEELLSIVRESCEIPRVRD